MKIKGFLEAYFETGFDSIRWCFYESETVDRECFRDYKFLHTLKNGDHLKVFNKNNDLIWQGTVDLNLDNRLIFPYSVWGTQNNVSDIVWLNMFLEESKAELETKE